MEDPELREEVRRYLRQRIESGDTERLLVPVAGASRRQDAATHEPAGAPPAPVHEPADTAPAGPHPLPEAARSRGVEGDSLERIAAEVRECTRCRLAKTRQNAVPGVGPAHAGVVFIGEGPGAEEDLQGKPFVGPAGQLLTKIIESVRFRREDVFITNIVKCRPPQNRDPQPDEVTACEPYLKRQLDVLHPKVICALGRHAGSWLAGAPETMGALREGIRTYEGIRVFPTYHPAALLRNPQWKRPVWEDIQKLRTEYDRLANES